MTILPDGLEENKTQLLAEVPIACETLYDLLVRLRRQERVFFKSSDDFHCYVSESKSPSDIGYRGTEKPGFHCFHPVKGNFAFRENNLGEELFLNEKLTAHYLSFNGIDYLGEADRKRKAAKVDAADWHPLLIIDVDNENPKRVVGANYSEEALRACVKYSESKSIYVRDKHGLIYNYSLVAVDGRETPLIEPISVEAYINRFKRIYDALSVKDNGITEYFVNDLGDGKSVLSHRAEQGRVRFDPVEHPEHVPAVVWNISAQLIREAREVCSVAATQEQVNNYLWHRDPFKGKFGEFPEAVMFFEKPMNIFSTESEIKPAPKQTAPISGMPKKSHLEDSVLPVFSRPGVDGRLLECRVVTSWDAPKEDRVSLQFLVGASSVISRISTGEVMPMEKLATLDFAATFYKKLHSIGAVAVWDLQVPLFNDEPEKISSALQEARNNADLAVLKAIKNLDLVVTESKRNGEPVFIENKLFKWSANCPDVLLCKDTNKVIDQGAYIEDGIPEGIVDERIIGATKQFWRGLTVLRELSEQTMRVGKALVIIVEHPTPAFEDTGARDEMHRVLTDAAHTIKNGKEFPILLVDTNGATVGSIREVTAFPFMPALEGYFAYGSVDVSGMPREKVIQVLESFDEKKGAFFDGEQQVGFIHLEREHENVLTTDAVQQSEIDHSL